MVRCTLLSGAIGVGKTTVARLLAAETGAEFIPVRDALAARLGLEEPDRRTLQVEGAELDRRTAGRWLQEYVLEKLEEYPAVVIDALRTERQTLPILDRVPSSALVYLEAHHDTRRRRYAIAAMSDQLKSETPFAVAIQHPTEIDVVRLRSSAALVIETDDLSAGQVVAEIVTVLGVSSLPD